MSKNDNFRGAQTPTAQTPTQAPRSGELVERAQNRLPKISQDPANVAGVVDALCGALALDDTIYQQSGQLVSVDGLALRTYPLTAGILAYKLSKLIRFYSVGRRGSWEASAPQLNLLNICLEMRSWPGVPEVHYLTPFPLIRGDGSVAPTGYDAESRVYSAGAHVHIAPHITQADANAALRTFEDIFCDFPWAGPRDKSCITALGLTILLRHIIGANPVPAFLFDANQRGVGKSKQIHTLWGILSGQEMRIKSWGTSQEEITKELHSIVQEGLLFVPFDNIGLKSDFGGAMLDALLTSTSVQYRPLGVTAIRSAQWRGVICGNGNNVRLQGDTSRRVILSRLHWDKPNPELRSGFKYALPEYALGAARSELLTCLYTIACGWLQAGRPTSDLGVMGSFEVWAGIVPQMLAWAGAPNILGAKAVDECNSEIEAFGMLLAAWERTWGAKPVSAQVVLSEGTSNRESRLWEAIEGLIARPNVQLLTKTLRAYKGRPFFVEDHMLTLRYRTLHGYGMWELHRTECPK